MSHLVSADFTDTALQQSYWSFRSSNLPEFRIKFVTDSTTAWIVVLWGVALRLVTSVLEKFSGFMLI